MIRYATVSKLLPDRDGVSHIRMGFKTYDTLEEAEEAALVPLRQNLPYRNKVISFFCPFSVDTEPERTHSNSSAIND